MAEGEKHEIVNQYMKALELSDNYGATLSAKLFNKGLVGKKVDSETIDEVVDFLHSDEVADMIKQTLGSKADKDMSNEQLLAKYGLRKDQIKSLLDDYESITPNVLLTISQNLANRVQAEMTSHHAAYLANIAHDDAKKARGIVKDLYRTTGGEPFAKNNDKTIDNLADPGAFHDHIARAYQEGTFSQKYFENSGKIKKPLNLD